MTTRQTLPMLWLLSDARNDAVLEDSLSALPKGSGFVFRHYHLAGEQRRARYERLSEVARAHKHTVILSGEEDWDADGVYGNCARRSPGMRLGTAHRKDEIAMAVEAGADAVFLSPVFPTASHPGASTLGVRGFHVLARQSPVPVIALGGMNSARARELDWPRWGAIDGLASAKNP